jgi:hypothetical protein
MQGLLTLLAASALIFGTMAGWLARERGRNVFPWVVVGALTGPLALLLVGFAPMRADNSSFKWCVECIEAIDIEAITCSYCGAHQPDEDELEDG